MTAPNYINRTVWIKAYSDMLEVYDTDGDENGIIAIHTRSHSTGKWIMDIDHYLEVLLLKPGAVKNSVALSQMPVGLQRVYEKYFGASKSKAFVQMLLWARENKHTYQEIYSAVRLSEMKGVKDITVDAIKSAIISSKESINQKSNQTSIETNSGNNLRHYGVLFNLSKQIEYGDVNSYR